MKTINISREFSCLPSTIFGIEIQTFPTLTTHYYARALDVQPFLVGNDVFERISDGSGKQFDEHWIGLGNDEPFKTIIAEKLKIVNKYKRNEYDYWLQTPGHKIPNLLYPNFGNG